MSGVGGISGLSGSGTLQDILQLRQSIIDKSQILQQVHSSSGTTGSVPTSGSTAAQGGFTGALQSALDSVASTQSTADSLSASYEEGKTTDVAKVMLAREQASMGFEATMQVRNKLLSAYQDIMKLGI